MEYGAHNNMGAKKGKHYVLAICVPGIGNS